jgi:hypothetical protein
MPIFGAVGAIVAGALGAEAGTIAVVAAIGTGIGAAVQMSLTDNSSSSASLGAGGGGTLLDALKAMQASTQAEAQSVGQLGDVSLLSTISTNAQTVAQQTQAAADRQSLQTGLLMVGGLAAVAIVLATL